MGKEWLRNADAFEKYREEQEIHSKEYTGQVIMEYNSERREQDTSLREKFLYTQVRLHPQRAKEIIDTLHLDSIYSIEDILRDGNGTLIAHLLVPAEGGIFDSREYSVFVELSLLENITPDISRTMFI